jgi:hypothetical protein
MKKFDQYCSNLAVLAQAAQEDILQRYPALVDPS